ncbi:MAG: DNA polymerase III subunit delta [Oscillospiraceae bacterium]|jgi:DNA polymerase-3 subunit delta
MPFVNENDLAKAVRAGEIASLYYFFGKDTATLEAYTKKLISKLVKKEDQAYNLHSFEGKALDLSELSDVTEALPMFSDRVCVTINDLNANALSESDFLFIKELLSELPETTTVIIYSTGIDLFGGKKFLTGNNKKLSDLASKKGFCCEFKDKSASEISKSIISRAAKCKASISKRTAEYLANQCLCNILLINSELDKLCAYAGDGEITEQTVDLLVSKQLDSNAFALAKALAKFNGKSAMLLVDELFDQQTESISILSAVAMAFSDLYRARAAIDSGVSQNDVINDFAYKGREFAVKNAFSDCRGISVVRLRQCINILAETDIALKSSRTQPRLLLEQAFTRMLSQQNN